MIAAVFAAIALKLSGEVGSGTGINMLLDLPGGVPGTALIAVSNYELLLS